MQSHQQVTIYYDKVNLESNPYEVFPGCPSIKMHWRQATEYAEKQITNGTWSKYLIPALTKLKTSFLDKEYSEEEKVSYIECNCGNREEVENDQDIKETCNFLFSYHVEGESIIYYICLDCHNEVEFNNEH